MSVQDICHNLFNFVLHIINHDSIDYKYNLPFRGIDLMKVGDVTKKSLKLVAVNLKWYKIQDLPFPIGKIIVDKDLQTLHDYNLNDVNITHELYKKLLPSIELRYDIEKLYGVKVLNETKSGIANRLLEKFYSEATGLKIKAFRQLRTERDRIPFRSVVFDKIKFRTKELNELLERVKNHTYYKGQPFFNRVITFDKIKYQLGIGGLHSVDKGTSYKSTKNIKLIEADVNSMYPGIIINHHLCPEHLDPRFLSKYKEVVDRRSRAKKEGKRLEVQTLKIVVLSTWGKTMYEHSWLYDPIVGLRITVNGQLFLLMLIEDLVLKGFKVISANTDGVVTMVERNREEEYKEVCKNWEKRADFELEFTEYKEYIRKDVNNYLVIKKDGSTKEKGNFVTDISLQKGYDSPIVAKALRNYFVKHISIQDTIYKCKDIYDFCIAKKIDKKFFNEYTTVEEGKLVKERIQQSVRFYISRSNGTLHKVNKETGQCVNYAANKNVTIFNTFVKHKSIRDYDVNYNYYISAVNKVINQIENPQLNLF